MLKKTWLISLLFKNVSHTHTHTIHVWVCVCAASLPGNLSPVFDLRSESLCSQSFNLCRMFLWHQMLLHAEAIPPHRTSRAKRAGLSLTVLLLAVLDTGTSELGLFLLIFHLRVIWSSLGSQESTLMQACLWIACHSFNFAHCYERVKNRFLL